MFLILKKHTSIKVIIATSIIFFGLYFSIPAVEETVDLYIRLDTVSQREVLWEAGADVITDYPVFGVGPGVFYKYFYSYAPSYLFDFFLFRYLEIW
jgi:O-antigen ligase